MIFGLTKTWDGPDVLDEILLGSKLATSARLIATKLWSFLPDVSGWRQDGYWIRRRPSGQRVTSPVTSAGGPPIAKVLVGTTKLARSKA